MESLWNESCCSHQKCGRWRSQLAVIIKADSAGNILDITPLLWTQPSLWAKSNKKTFVRAPSGDFTFSTQRECSKSGLPEHSAQQTSGLSSWTKLKTLHLWAKCNLRLQEQLHDSVSIWKSFQLWVSLVDKLVSKANAGRTSKLQQKYRSWHAGGYRVEP